LNITEQIKGVDLAAVVEKTGVALRPGGDRYSAICPLHADNDPSFFIYPNNTFHCFGCGEHGDAVDYVRKLYGFNFQDAVRYLGLENKPLSSKQVKQIKQKQSRHFYLIHRESELIFTFTHLIQGTRKLIESGFIKGIEELEQVAPLLHQLPAWRHYRMILCVGSQDEKEKLIEYLKDFQTTDRGIDTRFDWRKWLNEFKDNRSADEFEIKLHFE